MHSCGESRMRNKEKTRRGNCVIKYIRISLVINSLCTRQRNSAKCSIKELIRSRFIQETSTVIDLIFFSIPKQSENRYTPMSDFDRPDELNEPGFDEKLISSARSTGSPYLPFTSLWAFDYLYFLRFICTSHVIACVRACAFSVAFK